MKPDPLLVFGFAFCSISFLFYSWFGFILVLLIFILGFVEELGFE